MHSVFVFSCNSPDIVQTDMSIIYSILSSMLIAHFLSERPWSACAELVIKNVTMRALRVNDIGLFFDMQILNTAGKNRDETFTITVQPEKCCLDISATVRDCKMSQMVGGDFGELDAGQTRTITLVWPTLTLYNRLGFCELNVCGIESSTAQIVRLAHTIYFNTTFTPQSIPATMAAYCSAHRDVTVCVSRDLNPFRNCVPENCAEKYFGCRSHFNAATKLCEPTVECAAGKNVIYDYVSNECINLDNNLSGDDLRRIESGEFDRNFWQDNHKTDSMVGNMSTTAAHFNRALADVSMETENEIVIENRSIVVNILYAVILVIVIGAGYCIVSLLATAIFWLLFRRAPHTQRRKSAASVKSSPGNYDWSIRGR